jgi:hypothetical protein
MVTAGVSPGGGAIRQQGTRPMEGVSATGRVSRVASGRRAGGSRVGNSLPLVFLDVDGVLVDARALMGEKRSGRIRQVRTERFPAAIPEFMPALIQALFEVTELWWCTSWGERANREIGRFLGIPRLPVVWRETDPTVEDWKVAGARPLARAAPAGGPPGALDRGLRRLPAGAPHAPGTEFVDTSADGTCVLLPRFLPADLWVPIDWLDLPEEGVGRSMGRGAEGRVKGDGRERP